MNIYEESLEFHKNTGGKLEIAIKSPIKSRHDLALQYTPGVAEPCLKIAEDPSLAFVLTIKKNTVAVVSDGSAVLGLGNIGALAAMPVMEGKAVLFKAYAGIDAFPICINTQKTDEIIEFVKNLAPAFGGINLEDISAPRCFEIEERLQDIGIPVFHDDQHGTAIVTKAALINAAKLAGKPLKSLKIVINGAGSAGKAIADMLLGACAYSGVEYERAGEVIICDTKGIISRNRKDISDNPAKMKMLDYTNPGNMSGSLADAMKGADVFIGVSKGNLVTEAMVASMASKPIIFAMANPTPEIMPDLAVKAGAFVVGTGRSDFPNQVNNVLAFPGIFRGAMNIRAKRITPKMKIAAAFALASYVAQPTPDCVIPSALDKNVAYKVAEKVSAAYEEK